MHNIKISDSLYKELSGYCKLNSLQINDYAEKLLKEALLKEKYGDIPFGVIGDEQITEQINEQKSEQIKEEPGNPIGTEIYTTDNPFEPPTGIGLVATMDKIISIEPVSGQSSEIKTNKEEVKPKKRRL